MWALWAEQRGAAGVGGEGIGSRASGVPRGPGGPSGSMMRVAHALCAFRIRSSAAHSMLLCFHYLRNCYMPTHKSVLGAVHCGLAPIRFDRNNLLCRRASGWQRVFDTLRTSKCYLGDSKLQSRHCTCSFLGSWECMPWFRPRLVPRAPACEHKYLCPAYHMFAMNGSSLHRRLSERVGA